MKFTAAGDALLQQRIPKDYPGMAQVKSFIERGDARFFNLETTLNREGECYASQFSGGTYMRTDPEGLGDLLHYGFNLTTCNNNHIMDFSYPGLVKTLEYVNAHDVVHSGVGMNLDEASAPKYLDTPNGRVALIAISTLFQSSMQAGRQSRRVMGRPGVNGIRMSETLIVSPEDLQKLKEIADSTGVNDTRKTRIAQGYQLPDKEGTFRFGTVCIAQGDTPGRMLTCNEEDIQRVEKAIFEAQLQADYILISVHAHEQEGLSNETPPQFMQQLSRRLIDAGAHAVIGHGPHLLRPIEVYKKRPIFYSLGDFILQLYSVAFAPEDFYEKQNLTSEATVHELLARRSDNFTRGLMEEDVMAEAVIPYWEMENGEMTKLELLPINCKKHGNKSLSGLPVQDEEAVFAARLAKMSAPFGVQMELKDGVIVCSW